MCDSSNGQGPRGARQAENGYTPEGDAMDFLIDRSVPQQSTTERQNSIFGGRRRV